MLQFCQNLNYVFNSAALLGFAQTEGLAPQPAPHAGEELLAQVASAATGTLCAEPERRRAATGLRALRVHGDAQANQRGLLSSPSPASSRNPGSRMCPSITTRAAPLFLGQMDGVTWREANCFLLMKHEGRGGEAPRAPAQGIAPAQGGWQAHSPVPRTQGRPADVQRKICSFRTEVPCNQFELNLEKV